MTDKIPRIAFFPDSYLEVNGAAMTCRRLVGFAEKNGCPFLCVHAGERTEITKNGSLTHLSLKRSPLAIPMDEGLKYDPLFNRYLSKIGKALDDFRPDVLHLTGLNDVSICAAILAHKRQIPLIGSWHTNLHEFASRRLEKMFRFLPKNVNKSIARFAERKIFQGSMLYYKMPKVILSPNPELVEALGKSGRLSLLMPRGIDSYIFSPAKRTVNDGIFRFGFVGRLRAEKNVRLLINLEKRLLESGIKNFKFLIVGEGNERELLEKHMQNAEFTGFLSGEKLAEAYANMDVFVFPSETDAFGNVIQEANCSGVPAIVSHLGGPKFIIKNGETGFVAENLEDYVKYSIELLNNPEKLSKMKYASREFVVLRSWDSVFEGVYRGYEKTLEIAKERGQSI
jgi:phosphatidylinositol alpha 1,6-mannosyltransferase